MTWDRIKALAVKLRSERTPEARMGWALAALLSLPHEGREALIDHLVRTWGRDVLLRRLSKTYDAGGSEHG